MAPRNAGSSTPLSAATAASQAASTCDGLGNGVFQPNSALRCGTTAPQKHASGAQSCPTLPPTPLHMTLDIPHLCPNVKLLPRRARRLQLHSIFH